MPLAPGRWRLRRFPDAVPDAAGDLRRDAAAPGGPYDVGFLLHVFHFIRRFVRSISGCRRVIEDVHLYQVETKLQGLLVIPATHIKDSRGPSQGPFRVTAEESSWPSG